MAVFTANKLGNNAETDLSKLDLSTGPHALTYNLSGVLYLDCTDAGGITVNLSGDGVTSASCSGYGSLPNISSGVDIAASDGDIVAVQLREYSKYLGAVGNNVVVTITGATTSRGWLVEGG